MRFEPANEYCERVTDGTHDSPKTTVKGKFLITSKHIKGRQVDFKNAYFISERDFNEINKRSKVEQWDVIVSMIGEYCGYSFVEINSCPDYAVKNVGLLKNKDETRARWLHYYLQSPIGKAYLRRGRRGSSQPYISLGNLRDLPILRLDTGAEQDISNLLSTLDAKIDLNNRINAELESLARTIYDYWFLQFDFPDAAGRPYRSSGGEMRFDERLGREVPVGWEVIELSEIVSFHRGLSYKSSDLAGDGLPFLNLKSFNLDGTYRIDGLKTYSGTVKQDKIAHAGELLIAITDVTRNADIIGRSIVIPSIFEQQVVYSCDVSKVSCELDNSRCYLDLLFNSHSYHEYIKHFASGTLVLHLDLKGIGWYKIPKPSREVLNKFESVISPMLAQRDVLIKQNHHLAALRDWLLPLLMSGQVRVGEAPDDA